MNNKKLVKVPHTYVILFAIIVLVAVSTYFFPAGVYDRVKHAQTGRTIVDVASFRYVENTPVGFFGTFKAIPKGMVSAASIVFFVFIVSGAFRMIRDTGALDSAIGLAMKKTRHRDKLVIPLIMFLFSILGFTVGAAEEVIPFVPITIFIARGFGYDDVVGVAMVSTGAAIGFTGGMLNPFTVGIAHGIAELPLYSGFTFRLVGYILFYIIAVWYVMSYASKVKADPTQSVTYGVEEKFEATHIDFDALPEFTARHKGVVAVMFLGMAYMVYGVVEMGWYINEISALFIIMGIVACIVAGLGANDMAKSFVNGAREIAFGALVVGLARTIMVIMQDGQIIDSLIYTMAQAVQGFSPYVTSVALFVINSVINFFIPSGSGQAATVMPIMAPLADVVGLTRQTAVLAFQYGDAITNQVIPTAGGLLGILGLAKVPWDRWFKYNWRLAAYWSLLASVLLVVATAINYGPF